MVIPEILGGSVKGIAEQGGGYTDIWHETVIGLTVCEETEDEESQQWTVGITGYGIDGVDERCGVDGSEQEDKKNEEDADSHMHTFSQQLIVWLTTDIHAVAGGERRQGGVSTGERGCHNANDKEVSGER